ncbi:MAG TPA: phage major capsid protein [Noviherbaspirillum sp.]|jgi:HK97 family phage major capsid protein|uniref:phage major capsid protein n=1 Tax=Noviherbaspirillum sp. TaxID=1926288 RepID=UPI002DDCDBFB|nr:phage major capsid protein [Noviherbaspirillum sp.]HEV2612531.1 phage major capsid protein [Noviherbaspirillum sp.]
MQNIQALREKIANLANQAKHLLAEKGDQTWSKEDQAKFDGFANEIESATAQIKAIEKMRDIDADKFFENAAPSGKSLSNDTIDAVAAVALYLRHGNNVTAEQAIAIRNAMSTTTPAEGGYTVPSEIAAMVVDAMKAFGGMREVSQIISTAGGNALNYPTSDGTSEVGEIVAENAAATGADITFGTVAVNPYKYSSKKIALPVELIQDSAIDVVAFVVNRLATRLARITNQHYTTGTGSSQPFGVMGRASVGKTGTTGQTLTVTYDDLIDLIHSVNSAYRGRGARFMLRDTSVAVIRKLKDSAGRPIWNPGDNESISGGTPSTICGYPYTVNDDVAAMAANARSIAFGDFSQFVIRDVAGSTSLRRFDDSAFALNGQVGFCGWTRTGSNLLDTAAVKVYVNSAT